MSSLLQRGRTDANNFDKDFTSEDPVLTPTDQVIANAINQDEFRGFSFVNPDYGKLSLASESPATTGTKTSTTTPSTAENTLSTTATSSVVTETTTDTLSSNVTLTATNSSPKSTAANESYS